MSCRRRNLIKTTKKCRRHFKAIRHATSLLNFIFYSTEPALGDAEVGNPIKAEEEEEILKFPGGETTR